MVDSVRAVDQSTFTYLLFTVRKAFPMGGFKMYRSTRARKRAVLIGMLTMLVCLPLTSIPTAAHAEAIVDPAPDPEPTALPCELRDCNEPEPVPSEVPSEAPTEEPTPVVDSPEPTEEPTPQPTQEPTPEPSETAGAIVPAPEESPSEPQNPAPAVNAPDDSSSEADVPNTTLVPSPYVAPEVPKATVPSPEPTPWTLETVVQHPEGIIPITFSGFSNWASLTWPILLAGLLVVIPLSIHGVRDHKRQRFVEREEIAMP